MRRVCQAVVLIMLSLFNVMAAWDTFLVAPGDVLMAAINATAWSITSMNHFTGEKQVLRTGLESNRDIFRVTFKDYGALYVVEEYRKTAVFTQNTIAEHCKRADDGIGTSKCVFFYPTRPDHCLKYEVIFRGSDEVWEVKDIGNVRNLTIVRMNITLTDKCMPLEHSFFVEATRNFIDFELNLNFERKEIDSSRLTIPNVVIVQQNTSTASGQRPDGNSDGITWLTNSSACISKESLADYQSDCSHLTLIHTKLITGAEGLKEMLLKREVQLEKFKVHMVGTHPNLTQMMAELSDRYNQLATLREIDVSGNADWTLKTLALHAAGVAKHLVKFRLVNAGINQFDVVGTLRDQVVDREGKPVQLLHLSEHLGWLDLSGNQLQYFPQWMFGKRSLKFANLSHQEYHQPNASFAMFNNPYLFVSKHVLSETWLPVLEILDLSFTRLSLFNSAATAHTPNLRSLHLRRCELSYLEESAFHPLKHLKLLDISENLLKELPPESFLHLAPGASLFACCNQLHTFRALSLPRHVRRLDLSRNRLKGKVAGWFTGEGRLDWLSLAANNISEWHSVDLAPLIHRRVRHLDLSQNELRHVDGPMRQLLDRIPEVDLGKNPFDCKHCDLPELQRWIFERSPNQSKLLNLGDADEPLMCDDPESRLLGLSVSEAPFNNECLLNPWLAVGLPMLVFVVLAFIVVALAYNYRFEIAYMRHLWRIRNKHRNTAIETSLENVQYDAFVSYSGADCDWVIQHLLPNLEVAHDYRLCLHERDFEVGSFIMDNISQHIGYSRHVVLLLSPSFVASKWCQFELKLAQMRMFEGGDGEGGADFLVLVELSRLDKRKLPNTLRLLMSTRTYLEWPSEESGHEDFFRRFRAALGPPRAFRQQQQQQAPLQIFSISG